MNERIFAFIIIPFLILAGCAGLVDENPYWHGGNEFFDTQRIYNDARFPNLVVAKDGSVLATWSRDTAYETRRSEDGGKTWGPVKTVTHMNWWQDGFPGPGVHAGGVTVDENSGDILVFVEAFRPPMDAPLYVYRSSDHGQSWELQEDVRIHPDKNGDVPSGHMQDTGITLQHGEHAGRLIRTSRVVGEHVSAIYSDDGGRTWHTSEPFPAKVTNEAAIAELSDGSLYINSRITRSDDSLSAFWRHTARSYDGGHTWEDLEVSDVLPDGPQHHPYGLMGGLVRLRVEGHDILLFSNVDVPVTEQVEWDQRTTRRERGTIWVSFDGGETWPVKRLVYEGAFGYSSLAAGREGTPSEGWIYLEYESRSHPDSRFDIGFVARFNLDWLTGGRDWKDFIPK